MKTVLSLICIAAMVALPMLALAQQSKNINTMAKAEIMALKCGLGEVKAQRIIDEREKGEFSSFSDLQTRVKGVGPKTIGKLEAKGVICAPAR